VRCSCASHSCGKAATFRRFSDANEKGGDTDLDQSRSGIPLEYFGEPLAREKNDTMWKWRICLPSKNLYRETACGLFDEILG
jgi:hypothetical protein